MLQQVVIKRIERTFRLRMLFAIHLALFGMGMLLFALNAVDAARLQAAALVLMTWLPVLLLHTVAQTYYELHERCTPTDPVPMPSFSRTAMLPVNIYDENGNLVIEGEKRPLDFLLPPPAGER